MVVCQHFLRGRCRFGDTCRKEHNEPQSGSADASAASSSSPRPTTPVWLPFTSRSLKDDFSPLKEKPLWPLSSYGQEGEEKTMIGGLDVSPEELRVKAVTASRNGTGAAYRQFESEKIRSANETYSNAFLKAGQLTREAAIEARIALEARNFSISKQSTAFPTRYPQDRPRRFDHSSFDQTRKTVVITGLDESPEELPVNAPRSGFDATHQRYKSENINLVDQTYSNPPPYVKSRAADERSISVAPVAPVTFPSFNASKRGGFTTGSFSATPEPWSSSVPTTNPVSSTTASTFEQQPQQSNSSQPQKATSSLQNATRSEQQQPTSTFDRDRSQTPLGQSQETTKGLVATKLMCLIQGDKPASSRLFQVEASPDQTFLELRDDIWKKRKMKLLAHNPLLNEVDFVLYTPHPPILLRGGEAFEEKIAELDAKGKLESLLKKLDLWSTVDEAGLSNSNPRQLHIFVVIG